jgi:hypothetical protein
MNSLIENSIEHDLNPFIIFDSNARVIKYNTEAEYLLSLICAKELYDFALNYAPQTYGFNNSYIDVEFNRNHYYAIMVGYEDDKYLAVKLYKSVDTAKSQSTKKEFLYSTNIYALIEIAINNTLKNSKIVKYLDPSLPDVLLNTKAFLNLLNGVFESFKDSKRIELSLKIKVAENMVVDSKRYPVCSLSVKSDTINLNKDLSKLSKNTNALIFQKKNSIIVEFPLIIEQ